jgi:hypothetical protein
MIPVLIYLKCKKFRTQYNIDRELSDKQLEILKRIHSKSTTIANHITRKKEMRARASGGNDRTNANIGDMGMSIITATNSSSEVIPATNNQSSLPSPTMSLNWLNQDVPDPYEEDKEADPELNENQQSFFAGLFRPSTMDRNVPSGELNNTPEFSSNLNLSMRNEIQTENTVSSDPIVMRLSETEGKGLPDEITPNRTSGPLQRIRRIQTLPSNRKFRTPAFRTVPRWMPFKGHHVAWSILILTSTVTFLNIIVKIIGAAKSP